MDLGSVTAKIASGEAGFNPGLLTVQTTRALTAAEIDRLRAKITSSNYWMLPAAINVQPGVDRSVWVIGGVRRGSYHLAKKWTPGSEVSRTLGLYFAFDLAHPSILKGEIY